jgi:glycosyltransferase involved in cell wall biosynthesis
MLKVSVIIPNYNHARYISDAIQSALDQTYRPFEIIIVDDGSTDNSREVVAGFGDQVRYIWQENRGLAGARNTGIRAASGELIGLLDADDQWLPNFLDAMISLVGQHPEAAVYYCCACGMDEEGRILPQVFGGPPQPPDNIYQTLLRANYLIPSSMVLRRSAIVAAGLFDVLFRRLQDWEFWIRLLKGGNRFIGLADVLVRYRIHAATLSADPTSGIRASTALAVKHFGHDDGLWQTWECEKRRAYGGIYRYHLLTTVQRQDDWERGGAYLRRALQVDPTLAEDLSLFYELALGNQPPGFRGTPQYLHIEDNAVRISNLLSDVFDSTNSPELDALRRQVYGTAYFAIGLVAYNTGNRSLSRWFLVKASHFQTDLCRKTCILRLLVKSFISRSFLDKLRRIREQIGTRLQLKSIL